MYQDRRKQPRQFIYYCPDSIHPISPYEVQQALREMKYNKSPGADGITTEVLRLGQNVLIPHITSFFNTILHTGQIPLEMCHSNIILLHKKGDKADISNYRPISLISHLYKLFIKIIENRNASTLDLHQPPEQAGFRPHFSTTDHLYTINQVIEKYNEFNKPLYLAFVDYAKAFDSIHHHSVINALESQNIPHTYIDLIDTIYKNSSANIILHISGPKFSIEKGVKQGDPLSPKLFTSALQEVFKKLPDSWQSRGINVSGHQLTNLRFADDIVLFSTSSSELEEMLQDLSTASLEVGLSMNRSKTQIMTNSTKRRVAVDGHALQYVDEYTYLGQIVSFNNRQDKEVERRIQNAWKTFWSLKEHMKGKLPIALKRKLIDMCILPVLTYGAQSWSLTEQQKSKLKICQRAMERSIIGVKRTDRVRNTALRSITQVIDVGVKTAKLKWEWAGHVARMHHERWAKIVTHWTPEGGHRRRGRPRRRWCDDLVVFAGQTWTDIAQNREVWKENGEAFAQQWDT